MQPLSHRRRLSALLAAGAAAVGVAAVPATADAATASYAMGTITFTAAKGEANHLTVVPYGLTLKLTDTGTAGPAKTPIALMAGPGCWHTSSNTALCPIGATLLHADLGDGNDVFDASLVTTPLNVTGGPGDDSLTGGMGADHLDGGPGNDTFEARDAAIDTLTCGTETDSGNADAADVVAADCEAVTKTAAPVTVDPGPAPPIVDPGPAPPIVDPPPVDPLPVTTPAANTVPATIPPQSVGFSASGVASVKVVCPAGSGGCSGTVVIELPQTQIGAKGHQKLVAPTRRAAHGLQIGKARFTAKAGTSPTIPVRLSKRGRQRILRSRRRAHARIVVTTRRADGTTTTAAQDVTIQPKRSKARPRR
jgi:hypothetical protein